MSGPAPIWRERKMRLWTERPYLSDDQTQIEWGTRNIPVEQLNEKGRKMFGLEPIPVDMPERRPILEVLEDIKK